MLRYWQPFVKTLIHQPIRQTDILLKRQKRLGEIIEQGFVSRIAALFGNKWAIWNGFFARVKHCVLHVLVISPRLRTALEQIEPIKSLDSDKNIVKFDRTFRAN